MICTARDTLYSGPHRAALIHRVFTGLIILGVTCGASGGIAEQRGVGSVFTVQYEDAASVNRTPSDQQLENAVTQVMQASPLTANSLIVVHVLKGEVTLEGAAPSQLARREATRLAETVLGVTSIRNRLEVAGSETAAVPRQ
jgi:osmotically-inducible protein OsmY